MAVPAIFPVLLSAIALADPAHCVSSFELSVADSSGATTAVTLECDPSGGDHPHADRACRTLRSVDGDFTKLPDEQLMCPAIYDPVTVSATGHWGKRPVRFEREYPNRCAANADTASVFDFQP